MCDPIRARWLTHAARLDEVIIARTSRDSFEGTFVDVDADGSAEMHIGVTGVTGPDRVAGGTARLLRKPRPTSSTGCAGGA